MSWLAYYPYHNRPHTVPELATQLLRHQLAARHVALSHQLVHSQLGHHRIAANYLSIRFDLIVYDTCIMVTPQRVPEPVSWHQLADPECVALIGERISTIGHYYWNQYVRNRVRDGAGGDGPAAAGAAATAVSAAESA